MYLISGPSTNRHGFNIKVWKCCRVGLNYINTVKYHEISQNDLIHKYG